MLRKRIRAKGRHRSWWPALFSILILLGLLCFEADRRFFPILRASLQTECEAQAVRIINAAVWETLSDQPQLYQGLYTVERDTAGQITAVVTNPQVLNRMKYSLAEAVTQQLRSLQDHEFRFAAANLLENPLLYGRGPTLPLCIAMDSYVQSEIGTELQSAGVNQTEYAVDVTYQMTLSAMTGIYGYNFALTHKVRVLQIFLVGKVPQYFYSQ